MEQVATQVAVAADNAVNFEQAQSVQQQLTEQHGPFEALAGRQQQRCLGPGFSRGA